MPLPGMVGVPAFVGTISRASFGQGAGCDGPRGLDSCLAGQYRGHPLVKGLDVTDPVAWTHALQENILYHSSISLRGTSAVLNASNSPLEQFQTHAVGEQLLKTLEGIVV